MYLISCLELLLIGLDSFRLHETKSEGERKRDGGKSCPKKYPQKIRGVRTEIIESLPYLTQEQWKNQDSRICFLRFRWPLVKYL